MTDREPRSVGELTPVEARDLLLEAAPNATEEIIRIALEQVEGDHHEREFEAYRELLIANASPETSTLDDFIAHYVSGLERYNIDKRSADWPSQQKAVTETQMERAEQVKEALQPGALVVKIHGVDPVMKLAAVLAPEHNLRVGYIASEPLAITDEFWYGIHGGVSVGAEYTDTKHGSERKPIDVRIGELLLTTVLNPDELRAINQKRLSTRPLAVNGALLIGNEAVQEYVSLLQEAQEEIGPHAKGFYEATYKALREKVISERALYAATHGEPHEAALVLPEALAATT